MKCGSWAICHNLVHFLRGVQKPSFKAGIDYLLNDMFYWWYHRLTCIGNWLGVQLHLDRLWSIPTPTLRKCPITQPVWSAIHVRYTSLFIFTLVIFTIYIYLSLPSGHYLQEIFVHQWSSDLCDEIVSKMVGMKLIVWFSCQVGF